MRQKVRPSSIEKFSCSSFRKKTRYNIGFAGIAQLVERNLAKVEVASSSLVSRSKSTREATASLFRQRHGAIAKRLCTGLQIRLAQFDSGSRLHRTNATVSRQLHFFLLAHLRTLTTHFLRCKTLATRYTTCSNVVQMFCSLQHRVVCV